MTVTLKGDQITPQQREEFRQMEEAKELLHRALPTIHRIQNVRSTRHISEFKNTQTGKVAIIGNGMSALDFDRALWPHPIIGMNLTWKLFQADYHCIIDIMQFRRIRSLPVLQRPKFKHLFIGVYWDLIYPWWNFTRWTWLRKIWLGKDWQSKYPLWHDWDFESCTEIATFPHTITGGFSWDIAKYGAWLPSTMHMAIQLALHLGFYDICIWGLDLKGPKFTGGTEMHPETAMRQNAQFNLAAMSIKQLNVSRWYMGKPVIRIRNMSKDTACTAWREQ